jgi:hypothetical protein
MGACLAPVVLSGWLFAITRERKRRDISLSIQTSSSADTTALSPDNANSGRPISLCK